MIPGVERDGGRVVAVRDRTGAPWIEAAWDGPVLLGAEVEVPGGGRVGLRPRAAVHPILGTCHEVFRVPVEGDPGAHLAFCAAVDFGDPAFVPAMDTPGALPSGAGSALLDLLALHADRPLRYRGPYPTGSLFDALCECFAPVGDPGTAFATFNADVGRAVVVEPAVGFAPDPFERHREPDGVVVQLRRGLQRCWIDGASFLAIGSTRRLVPDDGGWRAGIWLGPVEVAPIARFDADGRLLALDRPAGSPAEVAMPDRLRDILATALVPRLPELVRERGAELLAGPIVLGDAGWDAARFDAGRLVLHAGWIAALRAHPPSLEALARAVEEQLVRRIAAEDRAR